MPVNLNGKQLLIIWIPDKTQLARIWLWVKLAVVLGLIAAGLLSLKSTRNNVIAAGIVWLIWTLDWAKNDRQKIGLNWQNSSQTSWMLELAVPCATVVWSAGMILGSAQNSLRLNSFFLLEKLGYIFGALLQDLLIAYCFVIIEKLYGGEGKAFKCTSRLFCVFHFPNPLLMTVTWWGGKRICGIFAEYRNLWTLALAHGIIGAAMAAFLPHWTVVAGRGFWPYLIDFIKHHLGS